MEGQSKKIIIFSAPSGSGKTTIVNELLKKKELKLEFSISACSRVSRPGEMHGKDYYFFTPDEFRQKITGNEFIEWEEVYPGQFYGTLKSEMDRIWAKGKHILFDIDVAGGLNLKKFFPDNSLSVFVKTPNLEILKNRLINRGTEDEQSLKSRIKKAEYEIGFASEFDYILVNDQLKDAIEEAEKLISTFIEK